MLLESPKWREAYRRMEREVEIVRRCLYENLKLSSMERELRKF
jgi:hypothetical protein